MKYSKRYIAFTFILALIFVSNFYIYAKDSSTLGAFRGAQIDNTIWSPLVAADVNGTTIRLRIEIRSIRARMSMCIWMRTGI